MELIRGFQYLNKNNTQTAGGKGASLGEMTQAGIPVPPGFVILSNAFERFLEETDLNVEIDSILHKVNHQEIHTVDCASEDIQALILNAEMPKDIITQIQIEFKKLDTEYVAVRSSATAEDGTEHAWAGQLDSYLNTKENELIDKVKHCWSSLFTPRAIFYRFEKGLHNTKISVAVVIQKMVNSEKSGIAFSVHPVTEDYNQLIIEAGYGLGEAIVSGQITPDSYVVEKEPRNIIDKNISHQERGLYRDTNGGNEWKNIPEEIGNKPVLSDRQIEELSELILKIERHYGFPCDIEWAFEDEVFYVVQSRPITTLKKQDVRPCSIKMDNEWIFMWSTTSLMPTYYATAQALLMRGDVYSNGEIFCYFDGHIITAYMRKSQIEKFKQEGKKFLDKSFFQKYGEQYKKETECWWNWVRNIESDNHLQTESTTLLKEYTQFIEYMRDSIAYFGSTRTEFTFATEQLLEEIIKKYYGNKWPDIFGILTTAVVLDDIQKEYLDWLKLLENKYDDQDLLDHTSKYPWLVFGQFHDDRVIEYIKKRISAETGNYGDELERLKNVKQSLKKEQNKILKNSNDDATVARYLATVLQSQSIERMNIKKYWAGSYYLTRKMWLKIAENTGLVLEDLIGFIIPEEVGKIISGNLVDDISLIINDRKRAYAIVISDGVLNVLGSNEATVLFHERIKKAENINNKIKGQTAMLGVARGKVRKVIAGDLDMLQESIRNFKQGEILVTSMTQPNMMVLAQKAAAIIADEGGITSHAAIIARELKVPCIVGCLHAMELLEDGSEVEVNANDGEIIIL